MRSRAAPTPTAGTPTSMACSGSRRRSWTGPSARRSCTGCSSSCTNGRCSRPSGISASSMVSARAWRRRAWDSSPATASPPRTRTSSCAPRDDHLAGCDPGSAGCAASSSEVPIGPIMAKPAPLLVVEDLRTSFFTRRGVIKAVDGVSFAVGAGETLALVGESGSGKSVTCLSLVRLVPEPAGRIVGGRVLLDGENLLDKTPSQMRRVRGKAIAMVLQDPLTTLNPALTIGTQVGEVVRLHQGLRGSPLRERVLEALTRLRIPAAAARLMHYQHQLSGGMRQRVSSAIAMSCAPRLLIADEPTTALDVTIQAQYLELLKEVQRASGVAVILVTHDFGIVAANADRVAVMYAGRIVEMGSVQQIFEI